MKSFLSNGELLFMISGYSFSDQHINEVIFSSLRNNNRLFILVFAYSDETIDELYKYSSSYLNITAFGPQKGILNGEIVEWEFNEDDLKPSEQADYYWDKTEQKLTIGDFNSLVEFIIYNSGKRESIEKVANEK